MEGRMRLANVHEVAALCVVVRLVKRTIISGNQNEMKWCGISRARLSFEGVVEQDATMAEHAICGLVFAKGEGHLEHFTTPISRMRTPSTAETTKPCSWQPLMNDCCERRPPMKLTYIFAELLTTRGLYATFRGAQQLYIYKPQSELLFLYYRASRSCPRIVYNDP